MDSKKKVAVKKPLNTKPKVKPKVKAVLTKKPKVIKLTDNKSDFKLENKAIYFAKLDSCYFCNQMMPEWEKAKQQLSKDISTNSNIKIYEIDGRYLNNYPLLQKRVIAFPTILRYNNGFTPFEQQRSAYNFSNFMKNG
tara:strand:- start:839 stop:1252 length:414 start_codon:yes stop_codon:yes gene_type:complete